MSRIAGFDEEAFSDGEFSFPIFRKGTGCGVLLMHELPGLTQETVDLAAYLAENGFHVVMPLLFGSPLQNSTLGTLKSPSLCIRREFNCLIAGRSSPITRTLRALCRKIHRDQGGPGVGAIGMCFTGGFVLAMMLEPAILAPVVAQPALPFVSRHALDIEPATLASVCAASSNRTVLGLRFEADSISPKERMDKLQCAFSGNRPDGKPRFHRIEVPGKGHSTLVYNYADALARGVDTRQQVLAYLRAQLG